MGTVHELQMELARHVAYVRRHRLGRRRWWVYCSRCKRLTYGPFYQRTYAEVWAYDESHRKAPACER